MEKVATTIILIKIYVRNLILVLSFSNQKRLSSSWCSFLQHGKTLGKKRQKNTQHNIPPAHRLILYIFQPYFCAEVLRKFCLVHAEKARTRMGTEAHEKLWDSH